MSVEDRAAEEEGNAAARLVALGIVYAAVGVMWLVSLFLGLLALYGVGLLVGAYADKAFPEKSDFPGLERPV